MGIPAQLLLIETIMIPTSDQYILMTCIIASRKDFDRGREGLSSLHLPCEKTKSSSTWLGSLEVLLARSVEETELDFFNCNHHPQRPPTSTAASTTFEQRT